jgi:hypothetical protein
MATTRMNNETIDNAHSFDFQFGGLDCEKKGFKSFFGVQEFNIIY